MEVSALELWWWTVLAAMLPFLLWGALTGDVVRWGSVAIAITLAAHQIRDERAERNQL